MSDGVVKRTQYLNVNAGTVRTGATGHGESLTDIDGYVRPMEEARGAALVDWGVAQGFGVTATVGLAGVTVKPGVGFDKAGRTVAVTAGGVVVVVPTLDPGQVLDVPTVTVPAGGVVLPTDVPAGDYVVTATWQEAQDESALANAPVLLHAPWLRLVPAAAFTDTGDQLALARVTMDDAGEVSDLALGQRRSVTLKAGRFQVNAAGKVGPELGQSPVGELTALAGGGLALSLLTGATTGPALRVEQGSAEVVAVQGITAPVVRVRDDDGRVYETTTRLDKWFLYDPDADENRLSVDEFGNVGIGLNELDAQRQVHVEGGEVHSGGSGGGFSFSDRGSGAFVNLPAAGERWVWYGLNGAAHLWSGVNRLSVSAAGEGGGLDVGRRMRVRQGGDGSAGIWFHQDTPNTDRAFVGMADDTHVGFWGNTGSGWGMQMDTTTGEVSFSSQFGRKWGPATLNLWGSTISDVGGGMLSIRSGGTVVAFDGGDNVGIGTTRPGAPLEAVGPAIGIIGRGGGGAFQAGVHGTGNLGMWASGSNNGILATGPNYAGVFWGHVQVTRDLHVLGTIFKGGGGFRIDHPLAPEQKYLSHSFVESPDMATLYTGTTVTDDAGLARVVLPDYFEALNRDPRVQLTTVGSLSAVTLDGEVSDGSFTIRSAEPGVTVSWLVTGVRIDAWAQANRIQVEEDKPAEERDTFLHADALSQPAATNVAGPESAQSAQFAQFMPKYEGEGS